MTEDNIDLGKILKDTFGYILHDPGYIIISLLPLLVYAVATFHVIFLIGDLTSMLSQNPTNPNLLLTPIKENLPILVMILAVYGIIYTILISVSLSALIKKAEMQIKGEIMDVSEALSFGWSNFMRVFATILLGAAIFILPTSLVFLVLILGIIGQNIALLCLSLILLLILLVFLLYAGLKVSLYLNACVIDNLGPLASLKESWQITKGNIATIFVAFLLIFVITVVILIPFNIANNAGIPYASLIGNIILLPILTPMNAIILTKLYIALAKKQKLTKVEQSYD